jgi:hypothetical protein
MMPFCDPVLGDDFAGVHSVGSEINQFVYPCKSALQIRKIQYLQKGKKKKKGKVVPIFLTSALVGE